MSTPPPKDPNLLAFSKPREGLPVDWMERTSDEDALKGLREVREKLEREGRLPRKSTVPPSPVPPK
jgi:hypothetical protein